MNSSEILKKWEQFINSGDLSGVVSLYGRDAILWGTFSNVILNNHGLIEEYFKGIFNKNNFKVKFCSAYNRGYENVHLFSGTYEFSFLEEEPVNLEARYTFVVCKINNDDYKIVEHHSSLMPD